MKRRSIGTAIVVGPVASLVVGIIACTADTQRVGRGEECFLASDCEPGLVCVPLRSGARLCSDDLTDVVGQRPPDAGGADPDTSTADAPGDAPLQDGPDPDTGVIDTGTDTGIVDSGAADG